MFLDSLFQAAGLFIQPWVLAALGLFLIFQGGFRWFLQKTTVQNDQNSGAGPGCLVAIVALLVQSLGLALLLMLLMPILSGQQTSLSWAMVEPLGFVALRSALLVTLLLSLVSFFPFIGSLLANSPGLEAFLGAGLAYYWMVFSYLKLYWGELSFSLDLITFFYLSLPFLGLLLGLRLILVFLKKIPGIFYVELTIGWYVFLAFVKTLSLKAYLF